LRGLLLKVGRGKGGVQERRGDREGQNLSAVALVLTRVAFHSNETH